MTKWYNQIPENPYKNLNEVPLSKDNFGNTTYGNLQMESDKDSPYFFIAASDLTLLSATPDIQNSEIIVEATTGTDKVTKKGTSLGTFTTLYDLTGGSLKLIVEPGIYVYNGNTYVGNSLSDVAKLLVPGSMITVGIPVNETPLGKVTGITKKKWTSNLINWRNYFSKQGSEITPTSSDLPTYYPDKIIIYQPNQVTPSPAPSSSSIS